MSTFHARTLGTFQLFESGREISIPGLKEKALVAFLCANEGRAYRKSYLADLLWERSNESNARHSLSQALYAIRRRAPALLTIDQASIRATAQTDLQQFSQSMITGDFIGGVSLINGPFLDCLTVDDAPEFEDWRDNFGRVLLDQFQDQLIACFERLAIRDQAKALASLPVPLLTMLPRLEELRAKWSTTVRGPWENTDAITPMSQTFQSQISLPWVGRHSQLSHLGALWTRIDEDGGQFALITGSAGLGKTRLLNEMLDRVRPRGAVILHTTCYEPEKTVAFGPLADVLARSIEPWMLSTLEPIWLGALRHIAPSLGHSSSAPPTLSVSGSQTRLFEAVLRLLECVTKSSPVVFAIDDLQWCDRSTRALLSYLSHRAHHIPLLVIGTMRAHRTATVKQPWSSWARIGVDEFTTTELDELLGLMGTSENSELPTVENLARVTAGHPYLVSEILGAPLSQHSETQSPKDGTDVPQSIATFVSSLLEGLPVSSQRVIAVLAVLGRPAPARLIARIAQKRNITNALQQLVARGVIDANQTTVRFRHDIVREAAYARLPLLTRVELHKRTADLIQQRKGWAGLAADHYYRARLRRKAYRFALKAVRHADGRSAVYESINYLELAIRARPDREAFIRPNLAERLCRIHKYHRARTVLRQVFATNVLAPEAIRPLQILDLEMAFALGLDGDKIRKDLARITRGLSNGDDHLRHRVMRLQLRSALQDGIKDQVTLSIHRLREFALLNLETSEGLESLAAAVKAHALIQSSAEAEAWAEPLLRRCDDIADHELRIKVLGLLGEVAYTRGQLIKALAVHNRALTEIQAVGAISGWPGIASHAHMLLLELGRFEEASVISKEIVRQTSGMDALQFRAIHAANKAIMLYEVGSYNEAKTTAQEGLASLDRSGWNWLKLIFSGTLGLLAIEDGDLDRARELANFGKTELNRVGMRILDVSSMEILIARVFTICGQRDEAIKRLQQAITDYAERDLVCRLKLQLELARQYRPVDRPRARQEASEVFKTATAIGARPLAERADSFLHGG